MCAGAAAPANLEKPPSFLKVGSRYSFFFVDKGEHNGHFGEIVEFGSGAWMRVQYIAGDQAAKHPVSSRDFPPPGAKLGDHWFNASLLGAVIPAEKPPVEQSKESPKDDTKFPKVGTSYYFAGTLCIVPHFAKVIEVGDGGWFRVLERKPKFVKEQQSRDREKEWWINSAFISRLSEEKADPVPQ